MSHSHDPEVLLNQVALAWSAEVEATPARLRDTVAEIVDEHAAAVAHGFYDHMLSHANTQAFLSHELVKERLHREMQRWLRALFPPAGAQQAQAQVAHQVAVGAVHARIKLPVEFMSLGAHVLSRDLVAALSGRLSANASAPRCRSGRSAV
ncbi:MAG: hypothetical protein IPG43_13280 [Proteobacteria bacterium]|nr:hypothetical protein [Pseudomonadota bacterium]